MHVKIIVLDGWMEKSGFMDGTYESAIGQNNKKIFTRKLIDSEVTTEKEEKFSKNFCEKKLKNKNKGKSCT